MLMIPKQAANSAGAVYILTWSWMTFTLMPVSPMNDKAACRAEKFTQSTSFKVNESYQVIKKTLSNKVGNNYCSYRPFSLQMRSATNMFLAFSQTWAKYEAESLTGAHVSHCTGSFLQGSGTSHIGPHNCYITYRTG